MTGDDTKKSAHPPIDPASPREQLRSWLHWLPMWFLIPLGLGPGGTPQTGPDTGNDGGYEGGYGGPLDGPGHLGGGHGDYGGGDMGSGGMGGF
ncbi:MAG: hypothetical protein RIE87_13395 [Rhodospirillales bacterium]|tara:strand:+ start:423 stop:701 length:279 start_codon:yes stop_codon:yes gene_type:complete